MSLPHCSSGLPCAAYDANRAVHRDPRKPAGQRTEQQNSHGSGLSVLGRGSGHTGLLSPARRAVVGTQECPPGLPEAHRKDNHAERGTAVSELPLGACWPLWEALLQAGSQCRVLRPVTILTPCRDPPPRGIQRPGHAPQSDCDACSPQCPEHGTGAPAFLELPACPQTLRVSSGLSSETQCVTRFLHTSGQYISQCCRGRGCGPGVLWTLDCRQTLGPVAPGGFPGSAASTCTTGRRARSTEPSPAGRDVPAALHVCCRERPTRVLPGGHRAATPATATLKVAWRMSGWLSG